MPFALNNTSTDTGLDRRGEVWGHTIIEANRNPDFAKCCVPIGFPSHDVVVLPPDRRQQ